MAPGARPRALLTCAGLGRVALAGLSVGLDDRDLPIVIWLASAYGLPGYAAAVGQLILPYVAAAGSSCSPRFFILAVWVYKIVRPHEKIGEVWERNLSRRPLAEVESIHHCPTCEKRIDDEWIICPNCRTRFAGRSNCSRLVGMDWSLRLVREGLRAPRGPAAAAVERAARA